MRKERTKELEESHEKLKIANRQALFGLAEAIEAKDPYTEGHMLHPIMPAVRSHHERWDGSGYPDKMKDEDIPVVARIVAIADAYDAMATDRPYKAALPLEECEAILGKTAGKMYDPHLIDVFVSRRLGALDREDYEDLPYDDGHATSST